MPKRSSDGTIKHPVAAAQASPSWLYDTSWTLHRVTWPSAASETSSSDLAALLRSSQRARDRQARKLRDYLAIDAPNISDAEDALDRAGGLRECAWERIEFSGQVGGDVVDGEQYRGGRQWAAAAAAAAAAVEGRVELSAGIHITLIFEKTTYKVVLLCRAGEVSDLEEEDEDEEDESDNEDTTSSSSHSNPHRHDHDEAAPPLLLSKCPAPLTKKILAFFADTFGTTIRPLKLPSSFLQRCLHAFLDVILLHDVESANPPIITNNTPPGAQDLLSSSSSRLLMRSVIKDLKLTLSFSGPVVAHGLKTLDVDLPAHTVVKFLEAITTTTTTTTTTTNSAPNPSVSTTTSSSSSLTTSSFIAVLAAHIHQHTGLAFPLPPSASKSDTNDDAAAAAAAEQIRVSRIVCGAFALAGEGRLKFVGKAVDAADDMDERGDLVERANQRVLDMLIEEARGGRAGERGREKGQAQGTAA